MAEDQDAGATVEVEVAEGSGTEGGGPRDRLEESAERAVQEFDERVVDVLSWVLDTETRARIFVYLRRHPGSTSEEVAEGTGLYPSTVREVLADLSTEDFVDREKRENEGAGNNPYEYRAIAPSELVSRSMEQLQDQLNAVWNLDTGGGDAGDADDGPVTIDVESEDD